MKSEKAKVLIIFISLLFYLFPIPSTLFPTQAASPSPQPTSCGTSDENAVCKLNNGLTPPEIAKDVKADNQNLLQQLLSNVINWFQVLGFPITSPKTFYPRSGFQDQTEIPSELKPGGPPENQLPAFLGKSTGIYGDELPAEISSSSANSKDFEKAFEKANFPEGVHPITQ